MRDRNVVPRLFVDRIEEGVAVLLGESPAMGELEVPVSLLPEGVGEGDFLRLSFEPDEEEKRAAKHAIQNLMDELGDNP